VINGATTYPKANLAHRSDQKNAPYPSKGPARPDFRGVPFSLTGFPGGGWNDLCILICGFINKGDLQKHVVFVLGHLNLVGFPFQNLDRFIDSYNR
jgi:hypothetical protein